ncbi:MAG: hypothetical protein ACRDNL_03205 [Spirillospora sp.]
MNGDSRPQWEFTSFVAKSGAYGVDSRPLLQRLNEMGAQGWQCVGVINGTAGEQLVLLQRPSASTPN